MRVISCVVTEHNLWLVTLAAAVCVAGSFVATRLLERARRSDGMQRIGWVLQTASATGASVWCTHFVAVLAYDPHAPVSFDAILTIASLGIAIFGFAIGFAVAASGTRCTRTILAGLLVGLTIATMHYVGMAAYHVAGIIAWNIGYVAASVALSVVLSVVALCLSRRIDRAPFQYAATVTLVLAIVSLHFTGMAAVTVTPLSSETTNALVMESMAVAIAFVSLFIVGAGFVSPTIGFDAESGNDLLQSDAQPDVLGGPIAASPPLLITAHHLLCDRSRRTRRRSLASSDQTSSRW